MLLELDVRDLGIIEHCSLRLPGGFAVLTGETGAGKSLLVQSLQLLAGARSDAEQVRGGCERLLVTGRFQRPAAPGVVALLGELGVAAEEELLLRREVASTGRSRAFVNDVAVTAGALQRLAPYLLFVDGQHEQRGLADPATHVGLVDEAGGLGREREAVRQAFESWSEALAALQAQRRALSGRRDRLDVIAFQSSEIDELRPLTGEDEELREERTFLRHAGQIGELLGLARSALGGEGGSVALARAARAVHQLGQLGLSVGAIGEDLDQACLLAEEADRALMGLAGRLHSDPARLDAVETRLAGLERLAHKYGGSLASVLEHRARLAAEQATLQGAEDDVARLEGRERELAAGYLQRAVELEARRLAAAGAFAERVVEVLARLGMRGVRLRLALARRRSEKGQLELEGQRLEAAADGINEGELLFSPNPGEELRSMARVASGGELARAHLAMRTVLRQHQGSGDTLTLLFDEVDSGIGGRVADELGELLAQEGQRHQVLAVTHLPQVAGRAGSHFVVSKQVEGGRTVAHVQEVRGEARVEELVRMLGGGPDTPAAWQHARELLRRA